MRCGRPRLLPAVGRLNAGLAPLEPGLRGAVAARGHSARLVTPPFAPPSPFFERQKPQRRQTRAQGWVRDALEQNLCLQRSLCFLRWVKGQPGLGHVSGRRLLGAGPLQHVGDAMW